MIKGRRLPNGVSDYKIIVEDDCIYIIKQNI